MSRPVVVLDACILVPITLCDLLLRLADADWFTPLWSSTILAEVESTLVGSIGLSPAAAHRRCGVMNAAFPFASVETPPEVVNAMSNHPKDRHVLATALVGEASAVVTANVKDFRNTQSAPGVRVLTPDAFLMELGDGRLDTARHVLDVQAAQASRPRRSRADLVARLDNLVPSFAHSVSDRPSPLPLPVTQASAGAAFQSMFPSGQPDLSTPRGAAYLWWAGLSNLPDGADVVSASSLDLSVWGDLATLADAIDGWSFMEREHPCAEAADRIVHLQLMRDPGFVAQAFDHHALDEVMVITTVRLPDDTWRVWGLSHNHFPGPDQVFQSD